MKIAFNIHTKKGPYGGGNQFLINLENYLKKKKIQVRNNLNDDDINIILILDPRLRHPHLNFSIGDIFRYIKFKNPNAIIVHRINECDERKQTNFMNKLLKSTNEMADHTVFVANWLKKLNLWNMGPNSTIYNGSNKKIFYIRNRKKKLPIKLVTHHWSNNFMKGFKVYKKIDDLMEEPYWQNKIEFTYIGNLPKGFKFKNSKVIRPLNQKKISSIISQNHIYVTGSICEPGGNHQNEGALCGLPILYLNSGCFPEYCKGYGVKFEYRNFENKLKEVISKYSYYKKKMKYYPHTSDKTNLNYEKLFKTLILKRKKIIYHRKKKQNLFKTIKFLTNL